MARPRSSFPSYRLHKASGQAVVTLSGRDVYLGSFHSRESRARFDQAVAAWINRGRRPSAAVATKLTVEDVILHYGEHTLARFSASNRDVTREIEAMKYAFRPLLQRYAFSNANDFTLEVFKEVRDAMVAASLSRRLINKRMGYIKRLFRWAAETRRVETRVWSELATVLSLKPGETAAREHPRIQPVAPAAVAAVMPFLPPTLRAMLEIQWLTGMRSNEVCQMARGMLDTSKTTWRYVPAKRKTAWKGWNQPIFLPDRCIRLLMPYLTRATGIDNAIFSPRIAQEERDFIKRSIRKSKVQPSQIDRKAVERKRPIRNAYDSRSYYQALKYGMEAAVRAGTLAEGKHWHPHQLRHYRAREVARLQGFSAARAFLGHAKVETTAEYAGFDEGLAHDVAATMNGEMLISSVTPTAS